MGLEVARVSGDLPSIAGGYSGELLIVGGGRCVWDDLAEIGPTSADVMCVNDIGLRYPGHIEHWYSNHSDQVRHLVELRNLGHSGKTWGPKFTHSVEAAPSSQLADCVWPLQVRGNSGLTAVLVALGLGYDKITVAGVPLDDSGHFLDPPEGHWLQSGAKGLSGPVKWSNFQQEGYAKALRHDAQRIYEGRVTFVSGQSRAIANGA